MALDLYHSTALFEATKSLVRLPSNVKKHGKVHGKLHGLLQVYSLLLLCVCISNTLDC